MTGTALRVMDPKEGEMAVSATTDASLDFDTLMRLAETVVPTGLLPKHVRTPGQFLAIVLAGRELGMPVMRSLRSLMLVEGKVQEAADSQLARFKTQGGRSKFLTLTDDEAVLWLRHPNGDEHTQSYTMDDARRAGLANKDNYKKHPGPMLRSRCITNGLKSLGWEGGVGVYDPSEVAEFAPPESLPAASEAAHRDREQPLATVQQRDALMALSKREDVFTLDERFAIQQMAADADLTQEKAQRAIQRGDDRIAEFLAQQATPTGAPEGNAPAAAASSDSLVAAAAHAPSTKDRSATPTPSASTTQKTTPSASGTSTASSDPLVEAERQQLAEMIKHPAPGVVQIRGMIESEIPSMNAAKVHSNWVHVGDIIHAHGVTEKKRAQGHAGMAARKANEAKRAEQKPAESDPLGGDDDGDDERHSWDEGA